MVDHCFAARPMITDDARIIDPQSCQVESWVKSSKDSEEYWALPACNPLGFFELTLGGSKIHSQDPTDSSGRVVQAKTVFRELCIFKLKIANANDSMEVNKLANAYGGKVHDVKKNSIMVELTSTPDQIKAFEELAKPFGIIDVARTGVTALQRSGA